MPYLNAHFSNQRAAMAAMDKLIGRGLGRARVRPLIERPSEPNTQPLSPADLGRARLEVELGEGVSEDEIRALIGPLGATEIATSPQTSTPFPADVRRIDSLDRPAVAQAVRASERGATDPSAPGVGTDGGTPPGETIIVDNMQR
jgi:hypothetical protein